MWRYRTEVIALRDRIAAGEIGRIVRTHGFGIHAHWGPSGWFTDPILAGGGALIDMGVHAIDTARFLLGDPLPTRVAASIGVGDFGDYAVDDDGLLMIDWEGGVRSLIEFGWNQPRLGGLEAETEVIGAVGAARIWPRMPPVPEGYEHCSIGMYQAQIADVAACCRSGSTPIASAAVGLTALDIVSRAYAAARKWEGVDAAG
jgi:predicted dehydrogenase